MSAEPHGAPAAPAAGLRPPRLVVVGGGISGLAAAHRAAERARAGELELVVLEASERTGGVARTERRDGFLLECGPDSFITEKPAGIELCRRIGLGDRLLPTNDRFRSTLVVRDGQLVSLPDGFQLLGPTRILPFLRSPVLSLRGRLIAGKDLLLPRGGPPPGGDESLASFVRRRFGREVLERLAQPLAGGIYTADPETLSLASTMPRFLALEREHRSVILGLRAQARRAGRTASQASGARFGLFVTLRDGMGSLADALAARLPAGAIRTGARVERVARGGEGSGARWTVHLAGGETIAADAVVLAVPAPVAGRLVAGTDDELASELSGIAYASSGVVSLAYRTEQLREEPRAFGFVVPAVEGRRIIAGSFSSVKYSGRAPEGTVLLRVFLGGALQASVLSLDDEELGRVAREEVAELLGIRGEPLLVRVQRWSEVMPQYRVGHAARVARIEARAAALPGLALAGNAYHGVGLADCIASGEAAADEVTSDLGPARAAARAAAGPQGTR